MKDIRLKVKDGELISFFTMWNTMASHRKCGIPRMLLFSTLIIIPRAAWKAAAILTYSLERETLLGGHRGHPD